MNFYIYLEQKSETFSSRLGNAAVELALALGAGYVVGLGRNQSKLDAWKATFSVTQASRISAVGLTGDITKDTEAITAATPKSLGADVFFASAHIKASIGALKIKGCVILMGSILTDIALPYFEVARKDCCNYTVVSCTI